MGRFGTACVAVVLVTLATAGCGSGDSTGSDATETPSEPATSTSSPAPSGSASTSAPPTRTNNCLFTAASVSRVLNGSWERHPGDGEPCAYTSDRGASFVTDIVEDDIKQGLRDAREACIKGIKPITIRGGGFVCVERTSSEDFVIGNIAARGRLWLVLIVAGSEEVPEAELAAMVALLETVRR